MPSKYQYVHELWLEQSQHITSSPESWMTFLKTASWTYKYRFEDQILIYSQKPNARACADFDTWNQKMNRWIKKNTKGIALLNEKGHGIRYVFDISDTRSPTNKPLHLWNIQEEYYSEFIEMIDNKYGPFQHSSNDFGEILMKMADVIAQDNCQDYLSSLVKYNRDSNLEYLEEHEIQTLFESLVSNTIAFEFINRCGLDTSLYFDEQDFYPITNFNSLDTIGQLGMTCHDLCEMGMQDISVKAREIMIRTFAKETQTIENDSVKDERSDLHENNHIQSSGRLPDSQSNGERTNSQQPLRTITIPVPKEQSSGTFIRTESEESTQPTSQRNRSTSPRENGNNDATIISEVSSTEQRKQSNGMDSSYEQLEINSQRSNSQGDYQQLDLGFGLNDTGGDEQSLPPFNMDYLSILLCTDIGLTKKKEEIVQYFKEHTDDEERTVFISECYDDTLVQTYRNPQWYDFNYIGYKKNGHGLDIWEGNYLNKKSSSFLSFIEIQSEISKLIDNYEYTLPNWDGMSGVQLAYQNKVFNKYALFQFMIYRAELLKPSSEIIAYFKEHTDKDEQAHFIQDCYPNHVVEWQVDGVSLGYVKNHEHLHLYYGTYDNQLESVDYTWSRVAYEIDGLILSRYYDPNVQIPTLEEQQNAVFENEESLRNGIFFSQEEIDRVLTRGSGFSQGKYRIYQQLQKHRSSKEKEAFLKHEYGIGGSSPAVGYISEDHDGKGITITRSIENRKDEIKVTLKWDKVAKRISELIATNRYLSPKELEYYPTYLQEQINNELDKERKQLESTQISNQTEEKLPADVPKEYQWHMGDTVYIGISEYEIIQNNDTIVLQDKEFPLFNETYTPDELRKVLEENPLNDGLLVPVQGNLQKETTKEELIQEYIPLFVDKIKRSSIYSSLRDRETTIDEAQELITSEMISIIGSINAEHREIYELYTSNEVVRETIINDLIDKTYQDYSFSSIQETTMPHMLYQQLTQLNSRIVETKSALIVLYPRNEQEYPLMLSYDDRTHTIDMFHFYEVNGIEVNEPFMTFEIDVENQILTPIYYENPLMNVRFYLKNMSEEQIEGITQGIQDLRQNNGERYSIKQLEKTKKTLKKRLEKLNSDERKDDVVTFEELVVDRIFVDESHNYKNLFLYTKMRNVAGLSQTEAQKSSDLFMKCQYLDEVTNGKGIVFATGTPISNSMTEMYTIQRYLQFDALKKQGLEHFDALASTFGETISAIELAPEGTGYRMKTRFAKFYNLPELINMFKEVADIKTADMLNLPVPTAHYENISVKPSEMQKEIVESLADRAQEVRDGNVDPTQDNMLKITNDGRKLALEQRLINPLLLENEHSKVNACLENVIRIYEENKDKKSTQLIFCDMSTPSKTSSAFIESLDSSENIPYTNVYDDIAHKLIDYGIPPSEIAYIHDAATDVKKKELFSKVRAGKVRILLGSTQKMGAGTNVQDRLIAIHDLDCPWRPSDLEQRAGRIVRQGNQNSDVYIYRYVTEQTFDAYLYQLVENKQKFISQIMTSKSPVRSAEDIDEASLNYAEIKALASGNPKIKEKMDLDIQVSKLKLAKANYLSERYDLEDKIIKYYPMKIASIKERISNYQKDFETTKDVEQFTGMKVHGKFYDEKELAGNALLLACKNHKTTDSKSIGQYRDFEMLLSYDSFYNYHKITLKKNAQYVVDLGDDVYGNITRLDNQINSISKKLETEKTLLVDIEHQFENAKEEVNRPFEKEQELQEKSSRLSELNKELDIGNKDNHAEVSLDDETEEIESRKNEISR